MGCKSTKISPSISDTKQTSDIHDEEYKLTKISPSVSDTKQTSYNHDEEHKLNRTSPSILNTKQTTDIHDEEYKLTKTSPSVSDIKQTSDIPDEEYKLTKTSPSISDTKQTTDIHDEEYKLTKISPSVSDTKQTSYNHDEEHKLNRTSPSILNTKQTTDIHDEEYKLHRISPSISDTKQTSDIHDEEYKLTKISPSVSDTKQTSYNHDEEHKLNRTSPSILNTKQTTDIHDEEYKLTKTSPSVSDIKQTTDIHDEECKLNRISPSISNTQQTTDIQDKERKSSTSSIDLSPADEKTFSSTICQQRQTAIDNMSYRKTIDTWRPSSTAELVSLIQKLSAHRNTIDRAWIIFYWISQNISYDTESYFSNRIGAQDARTVFQSKKAVCGGYSTLYAELCNKTGIPCREVSGYAKGFSFDVRQTKFDKTNHEWNIITLDDGRLYFIESTWGSGHLDRSAHKYKKDLNIHYFLCRPEHMIYGHLPEDDSCQLLKHPITMQQYLMLPRTRTPFFTYNLRVDSPLCSNKVNLIKNQSYGQVLIRTSNKNIELSGSLKDEKGDKIQGGDLVYLDRDDQTLWRCQFAPPKAGKYIIHIFAGTKSNESQSSLHGAVQFAFDVDRLPVPSISYPYMWSHFFDYNLEIIKPKNSRYIEWSSDRNTFYNEILVRSPDNIYVSATMKNTSNGKNVENSTLVNFDREANLWRCLFAPSSVDTPFEITLFARRLNEDKSHCTTRFDLQPIPRKNLKQSSTFPIEYRIFTEMKCHLIEPLNGVLPSNSTIHFRCQIRGARQVDITTDGQSIKGDGLKADENDIYEGDIHTGQKEVNIWVKLNNRDKSYEGLLKYNVK